MDKSIVDADTGNKPSNGQMVGRYFGYFISSIPLGLGILWVAFDKRKQDWHCCHKTPVRHTQRGNKLNFYNEVGGQ